MIRGTSGCRHEETRRTTDTHPRRDPSSLQTGCSDWNSLEDKNTHVDLTYMQRLQRERGLSAHVHGAVVENKAVKALYQ